MPVQVGGLDGVVDFFKIEAALNKYERWRADNSAGGADTIVSTDVTRPKFPTDFFRIRRT